MYYLFIFKLTSYVTFALKKAQVSAEHVWKFEVVVLYLKIIVISLYAIFSLALTSG